jgi:hypothetical protein
MWPKVIAQLFELLPHISRLLPMADKFLSSKAAAEKANEAALAAMAEGVQIAEVAEEVKQARLAVEQHAQQVEALKLQVTSLSWWVKSGVSLLVVLVAVAIVLLIQLMHAR